jgi:hypothetical protein
MVLARGSNGRCRDANQMWEDMANNVTQAAKEAIGITTGKAGGHKESWWWNDDVQCKVRAKQECFRDLLRCSEEFEISRFKDRYKEAKQEAKKVVSEAKIVAYDEMYKRLETEEGEHDMFKIAKVRKRRRRDLGVVKS